MWRRVPGHAHQALRHERAEGRRVPAPNEPPALGPQAPREGGQGQHLSVAAPQQGAHRTAPGCARHPQAPAWGSACGDAPAPAPQRKGPGGGRGRRGGRGGPGAAGGRKGRAAPRRRCRCTAPSSPRAVVEGPACPNCVNQGTSGGVMCGGRSEGPCGGRWSAWALGVPREAPGERGALRVPGSGSFWLVTFSRGP